MRAGVLPGAVLGVVDITFVPQKLFPMVRNVQKTIEISPVASHGVSMPCCAGRAGRRHPGRGR